MGFIIDDPAGIEAWRKLALYHMLKLEMAGITSSHGRASNAIRTILGPSAARNRRKLLADYEAYLHKEKILLRVVPPSTQDHRSSDEDQDVDRDSSSGTA